MLSWLSRAAVRISAGSLLLTAVAGIPTSLILTVGWPLPRALPSHDSLTAALTSTVTDHMVINLLAVATWLVWTLFTHAIAAELRETIRGVKHLPARTHRNPMRGAATVLISAILLGSFLTATAATASPHAHQATAGTPAATPLPAADLASPHHGPALVHVGDTTYVYTVTRGDYLSKIAASWLGDASRWPEICQLNKHRHFATAGGTLRDCNLIYPGWDLRLPADAKPPAAAKPADTRPPPARPPVGTHSTTTPNTPGTTPSIAGTPPATAQVTAPNAPTTGSPSAPGLTAAPPSTSATLPGTPLPAPSTATTPYPPSTADTASPAATTDQRGVHLSPVNWVSWSFAAAISAATILLWRQRRRRYTGEPDDDPPTRLPPPVDALSRAIKSAAETEHQPSDGDTGSAETAELAPPPPGGIGLVGDGASAAARAALAAVLASGDPHDPDTRAEVITDAATLYTLLGPDAAALGPWPRLHVTDSVDDALTATEAQLLHRSRILDEHALTDLGELRQKAPDEEALPPVMLITVTPPAGARMRAKVALALGEGLRVSALLLGEWTHGPTLDITPDGTTTLVAGQPTTAVPSRLPVLEPDTAIQILTTLREAQTGEPSATETPATSVTVVPLHASRTQTTPTDITPPAVPGQKPSGQRRAQLRILGQPHIDNITADGRGLRAKALEMAVYLAVHPDGAATREIGEYLEPDARVSQADQRVHTNASNLRHVLGRAGTAETKNAYVIKSGGRYRLDPTTVDVDLWRLRDLMRNAAIAPEPRRRDLLTAACDLASAPLAQGKKYDWIQPHRETVRRWGTEAHLMLADDLLDSDPQAASDLLDKAIVLDQYNEALYTKAMHARHALTDADGIRTLLRALTKALADIDAEPQDNTIELAHQLRTSLDDT